MLDAFRALYRLCLGFGHHLAPFGLPTRATLGADGRGVGQPEHHTIADAGAACAACSS